MAFPLQMVPVDWSSWQGLVLHTVARHYTQADDRN